MKKLLLLSLCMLLLSVMQLFAQNRTITGVVRAKEDGLPMPGVSVRVKGTTVGTQTLANGSYSLSAASGSVLTFTFIGYTSQDVTVGDKNEIDVVLVQANNQLNEVVVTTQGIQRQARSLGYSTSTLRSSDLTVARETNVLNALEGKVAGVRVNQASGTLGGSAKVVIRGVNSLDGGAILYVIDGLTVSDNVSAGANSAAGGTVSRNVDYGDRMGDLSPDDIATLTVLKGAAATALYGARARDGAIIITTKRGKAGTSSVEVNSSVRFDNPLVLPKFQNEYAQGLSGTYALTQLNGWGPKITGQLQNQFPALTGPATPLQAYPNNVKDYFQTGVSAFNSVAFSGGDDNSDYRIAFASANQKGIIPQSKLDKYNLTINTGRNFNSKLSSRFTGQYIYTNSDGRPSQAANNQDAIIGNIYGLPRTVDINALKNNVVDPLTGAQQFLAPSRVGNNPFWIMDYNRNSGVIDRFLGTYTLTYKPVDWITISNNFGADITSEKRTEVVRGGTAGFPAGGQFEKTDVLNRQINDDLLATFEQNNLIQDFKFKLILGGNINNRLSQNNEVDATNLTVDQLYTYSNAASTTPFLGYSDRRLMGLYGDLSIGYKDYLYLDVTGRNDWTSTLPLNSRSYFYPSVSGAFIFSELLKDSGMDWLSSGKLRASWASVGSDLAPYSLEYQFSPTSTVFLQYVSATAAVFPAGPISTAYTNPKIFPNDHLIPQRENSWEFGAELGFLQDRVSLDITYYDNRTQNQLINISIPPSTGYFSKTVNAGTIDVKGLELNLNLIPVKTRDFSWDLNGNFASSQQKVLALAPSLTQYSVASGYSGLQIKANVGQSFGIYGTDWAKTPDGQYIIDATSGRRTTVQNQRLGSIYPDFTLGINNKFTYKGFILSTLLDFRRGGKYFSATVANLRSSGLAAETDVNGRASFVDPGVNAVAGGGYTPNATTITPQSYWQWIGNTTNTAGSVFDAGFIKLREVQLAYQVPKSVLKNSFIKGLQIGVEGRNLWLIHSNVPHVDPELNFFGTNSVGEGVEFNSIPTTRSFGLNLRVTL